MPDEKIRVVLQSSTTDYCQYISFGYGDKNIAVNIGTPNPGEVFGLDADLAKPLLAFFDYVVAQRMAARQKIMDGWENNHLKGDKDAQRGYQQSIEAKTREKNDRPV